MPTPLTQEFETNCVARAAGFETPHAGIKKSLGPLRMASRSAANDASAGGASKREDASSIGQNRAVISALHQVRFTSVTPAQADAQITGFSVTAGNVGYLREAYHGEPYATRVLVPEAFEADGHGAGYSGRPHVGAPP